VLFWYILVSFKLQKSLKSDTRCNSNIFRTGTKLLIFLTPQRKSTGDRLTVAWLASKSLAYYTTTRLITVSARDDGGTLSWVT
jgi:hypothetical protein